MVEKYATSMKVKLLLTILDYEKANKLNKVFPSHERPLHLVTHGSGTANSDVLTYLGLDEKKKSVIISLISDEAIPQAFHLLKSKVQFDNAGKGIACILPVSGMSRIMYEVIEKEHDLYHTEKIGKEGEKKEMKESFLYDLIITIVNQSYSEEVMEAAKEAGARGGTVVHGRGLGSEEASKFLGLTIQPEKDVVLIVVKRDSKKKIMQNISKSVGLKTEGRGICFSLPVEDQIGVGFE